ncbi:MAG: RluA family pseudouridine synthase [Phycisphaerales bacterium]
MSTPPRPTGDGPSDAGRTPARSRHSRGSRKRPGTDPSSDPGAGLIDRSGKVDAGAVFRAARDAVPPPTPALAPSPPPAPPSAPSVGASDDTESEGDDDLALPPSAIPTLPPRGEPQLVRFTLQHDLTKRLDKYLTDRITFMSRSKLQALIESGGVLVNGRTAKAATVLSARDVVEVRVPPPPSEDFEPQDIPLNVLFEDEHLIVLNKSPDIIVHPARTHTAGTLINALAFHFRNRSHFGGALSGVGKEFARPGVVHRLDRFTSGLIVFAKGDHAHWQLARQFMDRTVQKRYLALAEGVVEPAVDVIDVPIGPHPSRQKGFREMQVVRHDHLGKPALTHYRALAVFGSPVDETERDRRRRAGQPPPPAAPTRHTLLEVDLKTGRTHQIRVHLSHLGFPLLGDDMYGGHPLELRDGSTFARQALHAAMLSFRHPATGVPMQFEAPLPPDLRRLLDDLSLGPWERLPSASEAAINLSALLPARP